MVSRIRRAIAVSLALGVTLLTLGLVRVSWTGAPASTGGPQDPGRAGVTRPSDPDPGRSPGG
jgi:hypothetical protein